MSLGYLTGDEREAALRACHLRGANRLLQLCFLNGGIYTKLGQHVGQLVSTAAVSGPVQSVTTQALKPHRCSKARCHGLRRWGAAAAAAALSPKLPPSRTAPRCQLLSPTGIGPRNGATPPTGEHVMLAYPIGCHGRVVSSAHRAHYAIRLPTPTPCPSARRTTCSPRST